MSINPRDQEQNSGRASNASLRGQENIIESQDKTLSGKIVLDNHMVLTNNESVSLQTLSTRMQ